MMQIYLTNKIHGHKIAHEFQEAEADKKNGWVEVTKEQYFDRGQKEAETKRDADLSAQYEAKHGKKPHHRMSNESIEAALHD